MVVIMCVNSRLPLTRTWWLISNLPSLLIFPCKRATLIDCLQLLFFGLDHQLLGRNLTIYIITLRLKSPNYCIESSEHVFGDILFFSHIYLVNSVFQSCVDMFSEHVELGSNHAVVLLDSEEDVVFGEGFEVFAENAEVKLLLCLLMLVFFQNISVCVQASQFSLKFIKSFLGLVMLLILTFFHSNIELLVFVHLLKK